MSKFFSLLASGMLFACGAESAYRPSVDVAPDSVSIGISVPDHPSMDASLALRACDAWDGLECFETDEAHADIRYEIRDEPCEYFPNGTATLGRLVWNEGLPYLRLQVFVSCLVEGGVWTDRSRIASKMTLRFILEHETGHALGYPHVSRWCEPEKADAPLLEDGEGALCGPARMNPVTNGEVTEPTDLDRRVHLLRRPGYLWPVEGTGPDILRTLPETAGGDGHDCVHFEH